MAMLGFFLLPVILCKYITCQVLGGLPVRLIVAIPFNLLMRDPALVYVVIENLLDHINFVVLITWPGGI